MWTDFEYYQVYCFLFMPAPKIGTKSSVNGLSVVPKLYRTMQQNLTSEQKKEIQYFSGGWIQWWRSPRWFNESNAICPLSQQQYTQSDDINSAEILNECGDNAFDIEIEEDDVRKALESINVNKGEGPDSVSPKLLRSCANSLAKPLTVLFQKSLASGCVPESLKNSRTVQNRAPKVTWKITELL